ncbi:bifunctional DNA primase/polymerase [Fructobacillus papyrifericola]|uniref:DNA replication protein n=1 Tax=Fructobacillus papyrifericola TaxID=2713172 RepID=A0ABS5QU63_9LACO|nr:bifunctional DNA primase/polymerase [Fructobacillus papyrifericola]MBS9336080.1 DNA replication protein [Fructobacillus papyrifericola]
MNDNKVEAIKSYMALGAYVFMALPNTKYNSEDGGYKNSFNHWEALAEWLAEHPQYKGGNVGIDLDRSPLVVVDVDQHGKDGLHSLKDFLNRQGVDSATISDTYLENTAGGGWHVFYKCEDKETKQRLISAMEGLDLLNSGGVIVAPSVIDGNEYKATTGLETIQDKPQWVDELGQDKTNNKEQNSQRHARYSVAERWGMIANGFDTGQRNDQATSLIGWVLSYAIPPRTALEVAKVANNQSPQPLDSNELEKVYTSVLKREIAKAKRKREALHG